MNAFTKFMVRPPVKAIVIALLTTAVSVLVALLGTWDIHQSRFVLKLILFILCVIVYCAVMMFYTTAEVNQRRSTEVLQNQVDTFEDLIISIISICETNAADINSCIHNIRETNKIDRTIWNFDKACKFICERIYDNICTLGKSKKYGVAYVKLLDDNPPEDTVQMVAYANQNRHKPTILNKKRKYTHINTKKVYHDLRLFFEARADSDIRMGKNEVNEVFDFSSSKGRSRGKYHLFIGIPVFCDNRKMVGLLEIVGLDETMLQCITRDELEEITNKFLVPYANVFLLLHKMEKALLIGTTPI